MDMNRHKFFLIFIVSTTILIGCKKQHEWTKWRGPFANGTTNETNWNPKALEGGAKIVWETNVGNGHSAVAVKDSRLYTMGNRILVADGDTTYQDFIWCLDTRTGEEKWKHTYLCDEGLDPGPGSTPVLDKGYLYTLSREGHLFCFDAKSGRIKWNRHIVIDSLAAKHNWGFSSSPVIADDILLLNINKAGMAFDKITGQLLWKSEISDCGFNSPVLFQQNGKHSAVIGARRNIIAFDVQTGDSLWTLPLGGGESDPVFFDDMMYFGGRSTALVDLKEEIPEILWENKTISWVFQSCSVLDGNAYGFGDLNMRENKQYLQCIDLEKGERAWSQEFEMYGSSIIAGDKLIVLTGSGKLIIAEATTEAFQIISSAQALPMTDNTDVHRRRQCHCWTNPVLVNGKIYLRNSYGDLVCVDVQS